MGTANGLKALGVGILLFALGFGSGFPLLFRLAYALMALALLGLVWTVANLIGLELERETQESRAEVGQTVEERFALRNRFVLPKLWLEIRDYSTLPEHRASRAFDLGPFGRRTWTVRTLCSHRGRYAYGPVTIASGDPFGLFRMRRRWRQRRELIVYPATVELPRLKMPLSPLSGGGIVRGRTHDVTPNSLGVREYQPGDALHRIHWPSTARLGTLTVKEFEPDPLSDLWIVLDAEASVQRGKGDDSTEEYAVTIAASLARHFLEQHRAVGLLADGGHPIVLPPDREHRQLVRVLEALAVLRALGRRPIGDLLAVEAAHFRHHNTVVIVTPSPMSNWQDALGLGANRRVRALAILVEGDSFDTRRGAPSTTGSESEAAPSDDVPRPAAGHWAADRRTPSIVVRRGANIAVALVSAVRGL